MSKFILFPKKKETKKKETKNKSLPEQSHKNDKIIKELKEKEKLYE